MTESKMPIKTFLCCFNVYEGSWVCGLCSLLLGAARVYLQWFNLEFRHRMTAAARKQLLIDFNTLQLITILQMSAAAVSIAVSLLMLIGLFKRQRWLLFPWLMWVVIEELFSISVIFFFVAFDVKLKCSVYVSDAVMFVTSVSTNVTCKGGEGNANFTWVRNEQLYLICRVDCLCFPTLRQKVNWAPSSRDACLRI
ncbi:uncharacterized protein LOC110066902 isoform X1 [Orbicella faveolata]|uniref:uncharacterized protein LOC110066902 isoform X1 n=1 Tax=Orbicella faveolata TaxID=48498 RepID=UPI0009E542B9|nr:uncharacterized protein LOC110066902 isoform X1 [Orbicella faveolata]